ncbi:MAG: hypothetical protein ACRDV9_06550 [Acidimicrobiia bacterium]
MPTTLGDLPVPNWDFSLEIPDDWYVHDPDPKTRRATTAGDVEARLRGRPVLPGVAEDLMSVLLDFAVDADDKGALASATLWEPGELAPLSANLMVLLAPRSAERPDEEIASLCSALSRPGAGEMGDREIAAVELPVGPAVRLRLLASAEAGPGEASVVLCAVQHWIPVPGQPQVAVVSASTPCLGFAEDLVGVFDRIAASLRFTALQEKTPEDKSRA